MKEHIADHWWRILVGLAIALMLAAAMVWADGPIIHPCEVCLANHSCWYCVLVLGCLGCLFD
jgi:disulfide bond formation protein DsbB